MKVTRRTFLAAAAALPAAGKSYAFDIGVTDWNLRLTGKLEAVALAARVGFAGVQVSLGRKP
ncbi:MAG: sugar phosphate isomerase/epimerase, partial [Bryobacterales bacterium]|nr:sugar phosphate isomerase/epimerase [Bryobacterales bacterium]